MKNENTTRRKYMFAALLMLAFAVQSAFAQTTSFSIGERVETPDGRTGVVESFKPEMAKIKFDDGATKFYMRADLKKVEPPKPVRNEPQETFRVGDSVIDTSKPVGVYREGKIESIDGDSAIIRTGPYKYDNFLGKLADLMSLKNWQRKENAEKEEKLLRAEFADEAQPFMQTVEILAHTYNPQFYDRGDSYTGNAADHEAWRKDLEALAAICRKYPNMTNGDPYSEESISQHPADICKLAEQRTSVIQKTRNKLGDKSADNEVRSWSMKLDEAMQNSEGLIEDELQTLLYERAVWEQKYLKNLKKQYTDRGTVMSPEVLKPLDDYASQIKAKIESDAAGREWEKPNFTDAALEALAKRRFAVDFPGSQVLKTGMTFTTWKEMDKTSFIGSDSTWKYYKLTPGAYRYKLGLALIKMPNRPMCQIRGFQLTQPKAGAGFGAAKASVAEAGIFVKCPSQ